MRKKSSLIVRSTGVHTDRQQKLLAGADINVWYRQFVGAGRAPGL
jgi:hypothetical protein